MKRLYSLILILFFATLFSPGCSKNDYTAFEPTDNGGGDSNDNNNGYIEDANRAILLYGMGNNSLSSNIYVNVRTLTNYYSETDYGKNNGIYVYSKRSDDKGGALIQILDSKTDTLIHYPATQNSVKAETLREVIADFKSYAADAEEYGLILSSHGSTWLKKGAPTTKALGQDGEDWFEIEDLASGIIDNEFSYIIMDACYMGAIEVAYTFRHKAHYLLGAPTEIMGNGIDYAKLAKRMFNTEYELRERITNVAEDLYNMYDNSYGVTVSLYDLTQSSYFFANYGKYMSTIADKVGGCTTGNVQYFDRWRTHITFDLVDYIKTLRGDIEASQVEEWLSPMIVYKNNTSRFFSLNIKEYCGVSTFIPFEGYLDTPYYKTLEWYDLIRYNNEAN